MEMICLNTVAFHDYWLENNSRRVNRDLSFVLSVLELYASLMNVLFGL